MKCKKINILFIILIIIIILTTILITLNYDKIKKRLTEEYITYIAVIVKVDNNNLLCYIEESDRTISIITSDTTKDKYTQGQEIKIYFDNQLGYITDGDMPQKIKIIKQESNIDIPDDVIRNCYNSFKDVTVTVEPLGKSGITLTIVDNNYYPYDYEYLDNSSIYTIMKKVENSYRYIKKENTIVNNMQEISLVDDGTVFKTIFDWSQIYGELEKR